MLKLVFLTVVPFKKIVEEEFLAVKRWRYSGKKNCNISVPTLFVSFLPFENFSLLRLGRLNNRKKSKAKGRIYILFIEK